MRGELQRLSIWRLIRWRRRQSALFLAHRLEAEGIKLLRLACFLGRVVD
jgi:hypothetical protein